MSLQQEADVTVLKSLYFRSISAEGSTKVCQVRNRMKIGGLSEQQFDSAIKTLRGYDMIALDGDGDDQVISITSHGSTWLMANFHWVQDDDLRLDRNDDGQPMTPPDPSFSSNLGAKKK